MQIDKKADNTIRDLSNSPHVSLKSRILFIQNNSDLTKRTYLDIRKDPVFVLLVYSSGISGYKAACKESSVR